MFRTRWRAGFTVEDILSAHKTGLLLALCIGMNLAWGQNAGAAPDTNPIGKVLTTTGTIRIEHSATILAQANLPTDVGQAKVGDFVYRGDTIQTGPDGKLGVAFADGSSFSVSANARMEVNEFVYDPHGHFNSSLMSLTKGTFTFIAGEVAHTGSMKVETPVGTMGIRGTAPRVEILNDGSVKFSTLIEEKQLDQSSSVCPFLTQSGHRRRRTKVGSWTAPMCGSESFYLQWF
jgi:hypothetical protein